MIWCGSHKARGGLLGSYLSPILQRGEGPEVTSRQTLRLEREFRALAPERNCKFVTYFCHCSPESLFHLGGFAAGSVIHSCSDGREKLAVCSFQRKKKSPISSASEIFPFHPTRGGSLKVIFPRSFGLGFALSRTREK